MAGRRPVDPAAAVLPPATAARLSGDRGLAGALAALAGGGVGEEEVAAALALQGVLLAVIVRWVARLDDAEVLAVLSEVGATPPTVPWGGPIDATTPRGWTAIALLQAALADNPAIGPLRDVLLDPPPAWPRWLDAAAARGPVPEWGRPLPEVLREPVAAHPHSLADQLRWVVGRWPDALPEAVREAALGASDDLAEVAAPRGPGPGPVAGIGIGGDGGPVRFTPDASWMPGLVLIARHTLVWLHQLSEAEGRPVRTLADIPDRALDELAARGVTGLWLIGLWERSPASRAIKRRMGQQDAEASAYSLTAYRIADALGGEAALADLRQRARARGIRLCADMVPNHTAIDAEWVIDHPERYVQCEHPPWDDYRFTGPDLSSDSAVGLWIEDGYWDRSGAAVVFKRLDRRTNQVRYLYHGNDGTSTPWNDTAQLDYTRADVREAVTDVILDIAARFDVIRFDAAMTLVTSQIRRLWHPRPGEGGAIPSRARFAMAPEAFDAAVPTEFWRDVVDRVQRQAPDTLLLAEAFWLLEGLFVRELGMHRVYNSAFMHMIRDGDNAGYRRVLSETLAAGPEILGRFVNFLSNPDEAPAAVQFGTGDRYFAACTLLATLPGLPLIGHGQFEGFAERYGMEYRRPRRAERPDPDLVAAHEARIVPLLRERDRFAGVRWFTLYDVVADDGTVCEDVFAYSNRDPDGGRPALVLVHNASADVAGRIRVSVPYGAGTKDRPDLRRRTLLEALGLPETGRIVATEATTGRQEAFDAEAIARDGLRIALGPYAVRVWLDWQPA